MVTPLRPRHIPYTYGENGGFLVGSGLCYLRVLPAEGLPEEEEEEPDQIVYHLWEMVERVANLFRIYPTERWGPTACIQPVQESHIHTQICTCIFVYIYIPTYLYAYTQYM